MTTFNIAIIDEDPFFMDRLENKCIKFFSSHHTKATIRKMALERDSIDLLLFSEIAYDIIFLEIKMSEISEIKFARKIREFDEKVCICFVTHCQEYALEAYSVHAFDYILKPVNQERMNSFFTEFLKFFVEDKGEDYQMFHTIDGMITVRIRNILYFEYKEKSIQYKNRIVLMHMKNKIVYAIDENISNVYEGLNKKEFIMPYRSFIVNIRNVKYMLRDSIIMDNGDAIPLSQKRKKEIKSAIRKIESD